MPFSTLSISLTSLPVAGFPPRMFRTTSTRYSKLIPAALMSLFSRSSKIMSTISSKTIGSTATSWSIFTICCSHISFSKSVCDSGCVVLYLSASISCRSAAATYSTCDFSFSLPATVWMTPTRTPTSMYITVTDARRRKITMNGHRILFPLCKSWTKCAVSGKIPSRNNVFIEAGTDSKYRSPISEPAVSWRSTTAKTKMRMIQRIRNTATDRAA
mmetsp:Transcript_59312/g.95948  ORF Transcript_59312/g.95948 Transcript_59312/m.95948 type:complete len:215 (+) Transcript_59312:141-785(+)